MSLSLVFSSVQSVKFIAGDLDYQCKAGVRIAFVLRVTETVES